MKTIKMFYLYFYRLIKSSSNLTNYYFFNWKRPNFYGNGVCLHKLIKFIANKYQLDDKHSEQTWDVLNHIFHCFLCFINRYFMESFYWSIYFNSVVYIQPSGIWTDLYKTHM